MPASYAHYRFGKMALSRLPEDRQHFLQRFRQIFDVGLHGPDLFFYYQPMFPTKTGALGNQYHEYTGKAFFETAAAHLREQYCEAGEAYLYGVLGHYVLDSLCHPLVNDADAQKKASHVELETEFDRILLVQDGEGSPHTRNVASHVRLTWGECVTVAGFYPPASTYAIRASVRNMRLVNWVLALKNRELVETGFGLVGRGDLVMYTRTNHKCIPLIQELLGLYDQALGKYPDMARQLRECIREGTPLGPDFDAVFG